MVQETKGQRTKETKLGQGGSKLVQETKGQKDKRYRGQAGSTGDIEDKMTMDTEDEGHATESGFRKGPFAHISCSCIRFYI